MERDAAMRLIDQVTVPIGERGKWRIEKFTITDRGSELATLRSLWQDGRGSICPGTYTKLVCEGRGIVMSDTPDEMRDHADAVRHARGYVLINGLGLGMVLGAILKKPDVERVTVVELDADVIALVGPHYACDRLEIVNASAFDYEPPRGSRYGAVWHDIWDEICADNLPQMTKLKRKYGRRALWQGCWSEPLCRRIGKDDERRREGLEAMAALRFGLTLDEVKGLRRRHA
jgi:hypothetical protein